MKLQLLVDIDLGPETSPAEIADAFGEAVQQVVYAYGNRGSPKYIGDTACVWCHLGGTALSRAEGRSWRSTAKLTHNDSENITEEGK